ncbi:MAG: cyclic nucleotide-binding domain-containing protein [Polyangiaceae bacterium]|nr:cyclic nucleotide-binding domain-containing protein [Polyangiaceae bacterium]
MLGEIASDALRDRVLVLRTLPQFAALDEDDLTLLAEHAHLSFAPRGTLLFREGDLLDRIYLLVTGEVTIGHGDQSRTLRGPGEVGLLSLFAGRETAREALVTSNATLLELPASVVLSSFYESTSIARNTIRLAARTLLDRRGNLPSPSDVVDAGVYFDTSPTLVEKMIAMRRSPMWAQASLDAIAELCRHVEEYRTGANEVLWEIGDPAVYAYRLEYGIVRCENAKGESVRVGAAGVLGGLDGLAGMPRSYRVTTETPCIIFRMRASTQLAILEVHPQVAARLRMELSRTILEEQASRAAGSPTMLPVR